MEQFSYEEWKKNPQRKVVSRRGNEVKDIQYCNTPHIYCIKAKECDYFVTYTKNGEYLQGTENDLDLFFADVEDKAQPIAQPEATNGLYWRKCKAGYKFPSDAIVIPNDERTTDRDPRLVKCAVWDSIYILIEDLKTLPIE